MCQLLSLLAAASLSACDGAQPGKHVTIAGVSRLGAEDKAVLDRRLGVDGPFAFLHPATTDAVRDGWLVIDIGATGQSNDELVEATPSLSGLDSRIWLFVTLTPEGGRRLAAHTSSPSAGTQVLLKLDDDVLASAQVQSPLGEHFQAPMAGDAHSATLAAEVLRSGALSFRPGNVTVTDRAGS